MSTPLTAAQQAQQHNRTQDGKYTTKQHSEADVDLVTTGNTTMQRHYDDISEELGTDLSDYANRNAPLVLGQNAQHKDTMHSSEDLAQDAMLAMLEKYEKDGGKGVKSARSWINGTMRHKATRMGEGKFHWPNSVAIKQYNELIAAQQQQSGGEMTSAEKDQIRHYLLDNWDDLNPSMVRHRPQEDFHLYTYKNTSVRMDHMTGNDGAEGDQEVVNAFLLANTKNAGQHTVDDATDDAAKDIAKNRRSRVTAKQIQSSRFAFSKLGGNSAPEIVPSLEASDANKLYETMGVTTSDDVSIAADAVVDWEQGEDNQHVDALMKPFGGEAELSMTEQQNVINALTRHGRDKHHVDRMWTLAVNAARKTKN